MNLVEMILQANGGGNVRQVASKFGLQESQAKSAIENLLPALSQGLQRNMAAPGGLASLLGALQGGAHTKYLDRPDTLAQDDTIQEGNGILGHLLGSKDVSRRVASDAAAQTGLDASILKQMLPIVATMVMGSMSRQANQAGLAAASPGSAPPAGAMGALASLLDGNKDGSVADDLLGLAKKFLR
jgi:hypothetical protein